MLQVIGKLPRIAKGLFVTLIEVGIQLIEFNPVYPLDKSVSPGNKQRDVLSGWFDHNESDQGPEIHIRENSITRSSYSLVPEVKGRQDANAHAIYFNENECASYC